MLIDYHDFEYQVLLGDVGTGKSSLVLRFVKGQFVEFQVCYIQEFHNQGRE